MRQRKKIQLPKQLNQKQRQNQELRSPQQEKPSLNRLGGVYNTDVYVDTENIILQVFDYDIVVKELKMSIGVLKRLLINRNIQDSCYNCSIFNRVKTLFNLVEKRTMLAILQRELGEKFIHIQKSIRLCYEFQQQEYEKTKKRNSTI